MLSFHLLEVMNMKNFDCIIKAIAASICLVLFFINNYVIFRQFAGGQTVTTTNIKWLEKELLPSISVCSSTSYKNPNIKSIDMESYLNNTFKLSEALISIDLGSEDNELGSSWNDKVLWNSTYISNDVTLDPVYNYYRGTCYKFKYLVPVKAQRQIGFRLKPNSELWIYLLGPEDDFYSPYDFWSDPMPVLLKHDKATIYQDVLIQKTNYTTRKQCVSRTEVSYLGCLRRQFASYKQRDKDYPNCTTPWQQQMLGAKNIMRFTNPCPIDQIQNLVNKDIKFTKYAATYNETATGCKMPCEHIKYSAETLAYDRSSSLSLVDNPNGTEYIGMFFMYSTTEVKVVTEELLISFSNFISSIGGNLGMFIGFSCFGVFSWAFDHVKRVLNRKNVVAEIK